MVKIHWSFYLILGAVVLWASYKIDPQKFKLFIWLGYLFLIVGIAKLGIWFVNRKKESRVERKNIRGKIMPQRTATYCPRCESNLKGYENFCPFCGIRVH